MIITAGSLSQNTRAWYSITKDKIILESLTGYKLPFKSLPNQTSSPKIPNLSTSEKTLINETIESLFSKGAIVKSQNEPGQFLSTVFTVPKPDGSRRPIINLKKLNENLECPHFKMENIKTAASLITQDSFMVVIDLKDAYHSVPIYKDHQKYLKFEWKNVIYQYTCLPFGLCTAPIFFTKLLKPVVHHLRILGIVCVCYLDDILIIAESYAKCNEQSNQVIGLLNSLGFQINSVKSQLIPKQRVRYLGFIIDSQHMKLYLPDEKVNRVKDKCRQVLSAKSVTIQLVSELAGTLVSSCSATRYGLLYTRSLEIDKTRALSTNSGNYSKIMSISNQSRCDLEWWVKSIDKEWQFLQKPAHSIMITSDASPTGWGAHCGRSEARGQWALEQTKLHINVLELLAVFYALNSFVKTRDVTVLVRVDSSTAMSYVNRQGGCRSLQCHAVAKDIWQWCEAKGILLISSYINTKDNFVADALSRSNADEYDFSLDNSYFTKIEDKFGRPNFDLFASYVTRKCERFYSWKPDPYSEGVDAFLYKWNDGFYAFPPFSLIGKVINKILDDKCQGIVVAPLWPTQPWFPKFMQAKVSEVLEMGPNKNLLFEPLNRKAYHVNKKLKLMAAVISGKRWSV